MRPVLLIPSAKAWSLAILGACALLLSASRAAHARESIGTFPVAFSVVEEDGEPVRDGAWLGTQLARAETLFGAHGVHFRRAPGRAIAACFADMVTRGDRNALASLALPGVINVFVVATLKDVDEENRFRFGVHWRPDGPQGQRGTRYIILSAFAPEGVLAHELGHYFGNPHSAVPDNVMSYVRTGKDPFFDAAQIAIIRASAQRILTSREVWPIAPEAP